LQTEKSLLLLKVQELEEKLLETQLQLERVIDEKLTRMLSIQKSPNDKTGLGYVALSSDIPSSSKIVFVKPTVPEPPPTVEDKKKEKVNDDVPGIQEPHSIRRPPIFHHCGLSGHVRPQCSLLKAQKAKAKKEVPRQAHYGTRHAAQHQTPSGTSLSTKVSVSSPLVSCSTASAASAAVCTSQSQWHLQKQTQTV
jgi:hypothetical protein